MQTTGQNDTSSPYMMYDFTSNHALAEEYGKLLDLCTFKPLQIIIRPFIFQICETQKLRLVIEL